MSKWQNKGAATARLMNFWQPHCQQSSTAAVSYDLKVYNEKVYSGFRKRTITLNNGSYSELLCLTWAIHLVN